MNKAFLLVFFIWFSHAHSQVVIKGTVKSAAGEALIGANIVAMSPKTKQLLAYAISGSKGRYQLHITQKIDSLLINVSYFGYQPQPIKCAAKSQKLNFFLKESTEQLKEVLIKTEPVKVKGDTVNYRVSSLKQAEDKVLVDVIKRIPGIEVSVNGKIFYQGKAINKFYIENMDMLEGRYNLAANNIPVDQIASVQVYENHQPVKLLDSLQFSDRAALNIRLKKSFSYALPVSLAGGYRPVIGQGKFVPMLFRKKMQSLSLLQANNAGHSLKNQLANFYDTGSFDLKNNTQNWTTVGKAMAPPFKEDIWLHNQSFLTSLNFLFKLNSTARLKTNVSYLPELVKETATVRQTVFLKNQPLTILEKQFHQQLQQQAVWNLIYEQNSKRIYLKNAFHFKYEHIKEDNFIHNQNINQQLFKPAYQLTNLTNWLFPVKGHLWQFNTFFAYKAGNELFTVKPGTFLQIFNGGQAFDQLAQWVQTSQWQVYFNTGWLKKMHNWTLAYDLFVQKKRHLLYSRLWPENVAGFDENDYSNDALLNQTGFKNKMKLTYRKDTWYFNLDLPVKYVYLNIAEHKSGEEKRVKGLFLDYQVSLQYHWHNWLLLGSQSRKTNFGDLYQNHFNFILKTYNQLERYRTPVQKNIKTDYAIHFHYRDILNGIHTSLFLDYRQYSRNILYKYVYLNTGASQLEALSLSNKAIEKRLQFKFSKYFFKRKISTKLSTIYTWSNQPVILNHELMRKAYRNFHLLTSIRIPFHKKYTFYLDFEADNYFFGGQSVNLENYHLKPAIFYYLLKRHQIHLSADYYWIPNLRQINFFLNLAYQYKPKAKKWLLYAKWHNITNVKFYTTYFANTYSTYESSYTLRPAYLLIGFETSL